MNSLPSRLPDAGEATTAIQTQYLGYRFRSRIEARWAVVFDALEIDWEYEKEGYALPSGFYLPDFWLPNIGPHGTWFEVKGALLPWDDIGRRLLSELGQMTETQWALAQGPIPFATNSYGADEAQEKGQREICVNGDLYYNFCSCPWCGRIGLEFEARGGRACGWRAHFDKDQYYEAETIVRQAGHWRADDKCYTGDDPRILKAYKAGRSARFEHKDNAAYGRCW